LRSRTRRRTAGGSSALSAKDLRVRQRRAAISAKTCHVDLRGCERCVLRVSVPCILTEPGRAGKRELRGNYVEAQTACVA
jgi:hypothetical protein